MKTLTQVLTAFIAINLITSNTTLAQHPSEAYLRLIEEALAAKDTELAGKTAELNRKVALTAHTIGAQLAAKTDDLAEKAADLARKAADIAAKEGKMQADVVADQLRSLSLLSLTRAKQGTDKVLLILTDSLKAQELAATTEDLNIMSRIFDKKLEPAYTAYKARAHSSNIDTLLTNLRYRNSSQGTQAIYLHGYGELFLMSVDFPLSPPPQVEGEKVNEGADPVWEQTKLRISASDADIAMQYMHERDAVARQYDPDKVEQLKATLIKALKHAANIRNLKPDESIILVVAGTLPAVFVTEHGDEPHRYQYIQYKPHTQPALLTIRAKKADLDAYAQDLLNLDTFRERVQLLTAHATLGSAATGQGMWIAQ